MPEKLKKNLKTSMDHFCVAKLKKITTVVNTNSHCKSVIIIGTIFYSWDYYNHIVKSTIIILNYIFLVDISIENSCPLIVTNTVYFSQCIYNVLG